MLMMWRGHARFLAASLVCRTFGDHLDGAKLWTWKLAMAAVCSPDFDSEREFLALSPANC
jgi:hypothetical protein